MYFDQLLGAARQVNVVYPSYIDNFYRINRLSFIVLELNTANGLISTQRYDKTIYPQEFGLDLTVIFCFCFENIFCRKQEN